MIVSVNATTRRRLRIVPTNHGSAPSSPPLSSLKKRKALPRAQARASDDGAVEKEKERGVLGLGSGLGLGANRTELLALMLSDFWPVVG